MIRALVFLAKVSVLVALAVWIADRPGTVRIEWQDYAFTIQFGFFLLLALGAFMLSIFIYRVIQTFVDFPRSIRRYIAQRRKEKGYLALTRGLAAVAAGDMKAARYQAFRTGKLLPNDTGLPLLLRAQASRLEGKEDEAGKIFMALTENKDAGFLGIRGLLQSALDAQNYEKALELARKALKLHPRQPWILKLTYDLEIKQRHWEAAKMTLYRAEKNRALPAAQAASDRIAILLAQAEEERNLGFRSKSIGLMQQANRFHPYFVPGALRLARMHKQEGRRRQAVHVVERIWRKNPHPDLARLWDFLAPVSRTTKPMARTSWYARLVKINPESAESHLALARVAMEEGLWGEARDHFEKAEAIEPSAGLYRLWSELEKRVEGNPRLLQTLQEKLLAFPLEKRWVCRETGAIYEEWEPVAMPHGSFNTIEWSLPHGSSVALLASKSAIADALIDAPRYAAIVNGN